ncbi:MAG TPA: signal peptide peptidase SppA [Flavobacterium sp.]|nr:signal peptide peptidase SppA [Flavobacterium sp.]
MKFLGNVLATIVGLFVFSMIFFFGIVLIAALAGGGGDEVLVRSNSVIELDLADVTNDYAGKSNYKDFDYFEARHDGLSDVIKAIDAAKTDSKIKGISILNNNSGLGIAQEKALRDALEDFKKSGKFVLSYANVYTQKDYYLNSVANTIYINPVGNLEFKGLSSEIMFFKDLEDKSGIKMEVIRHGKYKSAVEPFLENKMSDANREQVSALLHSVWNSMVADISKSRHISVEHLNAVANGLLARDPEMAKNEKLVDRVAYEDVYHDDIKKLLKVDADKDYHKIKILDYAKNVATTSVASMSTDKIAIVYAQGEILSGEGSESYIGEGSLRRALKEAREDDNVKAVVLRIDSPGGSALTADLIWREIELTKKIKPVVVSMGNLAASGGYYIACNANTIFAEENTITGSIGVFGMLPNLSNLTNKIGVHTELVNTHDNAADYSPFLPVDEKFRAIAQGEVERIYNTFVSRVAAGRKMTFAQVDNIAQGRVWAGSEAIKIGLVDKIGGMDDAIKAAAKLAKITKYKTRDYPEYEKNLRDLLSNLGVPFMSSKESIIKNEIGEENYKLIEQLKLAGQRTGVQAMMPFEINIH